MGESRNNNKNTSNGKGNSGWVSQSSVLKQTCIVEEPAGLQSGLPASLNWSEQTVDQFFFLLQLQSGWSKHREVHTVNGKQRNEKEIVSLGCSTKNEFRSLTNSIHWRKVAFIQPESLQLQPSAFQCSLSINIYTNALIWRVCQVVINMNINYQTLFH